ncbi:MAG: acyl-CoA dehydrogenase family protein [Bdellovibrionia bacterium]
MNQPLFNLGPLQEFIRNRVIPGAAERDASLTIPLNLYKELFDLGWWTAFLPSEFGGAGVSTVDLCHVLKAIAFGSPGMATSYAANMAAVVTIFQFGSDALKKDVLTKLAGQFSFASLCFTEADSGSDVLSIKTTATRVTGGYVLSGSKCFITNANYADHLVIVAKIKGVEDPRKSMSVFYASAHSQGISTGKPLRKMGQRDSNTSEVFFDKVFIPADHLIGKEGDAFKISGQTLQKSRTILAASAIGLCERASELVREHLGRRILYSKPLIEQPTIRCFLAQLHAEMTAAWYVTLAAAQGWDEGNYQMKLSSMAKLLAGRAVVNFTGGVLELHAGWGYTLEFEIERLYRDAKLYEILEGPTFVQQTIIAKELFPTTDFKQKQKAA